MYFVILLMLLITHGINTQDRLTTPDKPVNGDRYANFSQTTPPPQNNQPYLTNRIEKLTLNGFRKSANSEDYSNFNQTTTSPQVNQSNVVNRIEEVAQTRPNANPPSFHPNPGSTIGQIIPTGTPWLANSGGYSNFSQTTIRPQVNQSSVVNRIEEVAQTRPNTNPPSFHPNPGSTLGQIIPTGTPWLANSGGYSNFSQTTIRPQANQSSVVNRIEEVAQNPSISVGPTTGTPRPVNLEGSANFSQTTTTSEINPSKVASRIDVAAQIDLNPNPVSSQTPWPFNPQGYNNLYRSPSTEIPDTDSTTTSTTKHDECDDNDDDDDSISLESEEETTTTTTPRSREEPLLEKNIGFQYIPNNLVIDKPNPFSLDRLFAQPSIGFGRPLFGFARPSIRFAQARPIFIPIRG